MKIIQLLLPSFACCFALLVGCGGNSPKPESAYFTVVPQYGSPGAYSTDTGTKLYGNVDGGYNCDPATDAYCILNFGPAYASTSANPQGYTEQTNAVNGVNWSIYGNSSTNCSAGYPITIFSVYTETSYDLMCGSPTTDFVSSEPYWTVGSAPSTVTFTATNTTFPAQNFSTATTVYDTSANVQWSGTVNSSTTTTITVPISDTAVGTHILVFRNPSNNAVIGSSAYVVFANPNGGPGGCKHQPCSQSQTN